MCNKLTISEFLAVRRALRAGMRHSEIARELNLSVWTIARIDDEERYQFDPVSEDELPVDDAPPDYLAQNLRRCPGCGAMVYVWPCRACQMAVMARVPPAAEEDDEADQSSEVRGQRSVVEKIELAPCGRRRRTKRTNVSYRAKMAQRGQMQIAECG